MVPKSKTYIRKKLEENRLTTNISGYTIGGNTPPTPNSARSNSFGSYPQHYQQRQGIEALVANVLEDLSLDELPLATISEKEEISNTNGIEMKPYGAGNINYRLL